MAKFTIYDCKIRKVGNINADNYVDAYAEMEKRGICTWRNFVVKDGDSKLDANVHHSRHAQTQSPIVSRKTPKK